MTKRYSRLLRLHTFEERYEYLRLGGSVGVETFGFDRHINQGLYHSREWKNVRSQAIIRDNGCDLGIPGYEIHSGLLVHHINPISVDDIVDDEDYVFDLENLITTTKETHNAIHYGDATLLRTPFVERAMGDTKLW